MAIPENASLYPFFTLTKGQIVRFTALDPTDNSDVSAVVISKMVLGVESGDTVLPTNPTPLFPAFLPGAV